MQTPRKHQIAAIKACVTGLKKPESRGQCIMACGTGKTLVGFHVAKELKAKRVLVIVPSLLLVQQMIREYRAQGAKHLLAVCSDDVAGDDVIQISVKELGEDVTTDAQQAHAFLAGNGQRFVVCTYQSLRALSEVFKVLEFDLAIFDEAHKTAGVKSKLFAHGLTDDTLRCFRRLFMTATPRHATLGDDGSEAEVFAMNNPKAYGEVLYSLPLRTAIEAGIIDDYQVIVAVTKTPQDESLRGHAIRVAIDKAMKRYGIRKVFTFHARVRDAASFIKGATHTLKEFQLFHVNGAQPSAERQKHLERFHAVESALMTNARCLTEGVDLPAADMVAFLAPKRNPIDIVQAIGRVLRKHHSKATGGYVFIPVFVNGDEDEETAIANSDFSTVYEVLQALREQDEPLAVALAKCARGESDLPGKITVMRDEGDAFACDVSFASQAVRKAIRVKLMQPFHVDPIGKKKELLRLARQNAPKPRHDTILGRALHQYTCSVGQAFDPIFKKQLEMTGVQWLISKVQLKQQLFLDMAKKGLPKPNCFTSLGRALGNYTTKSSKSYNASFDLEIRKHAPAWFTLKYVSAKKELLRMAGNGEKRPHWTSKLGRQLSKFNTKKYSFYDPEFIANLHKIAPSWNSP